MSGVSGTFSVGGLISGLKTEDVIKKLMAVESQPVTQLESKKTQKSAELTAWREFNTRLLALKVQTQKLSDEDSFQVRKAVSSDTDILDVTAGSSLNLGAYYVTVKALAQQHQVISQNYADKDTTGRGTGEITISVGSSAYAPVEIDSSNNTLEGIKDAINNANIGVTASIIDDGSEDAPYRLILNSKSPGASSNINWSDTLSGGDSPAFSDLQAAQDAHITLGTGGNAVDIYKDSNVISDVISGVTLTIKNVDPDNAVKVTLTTDGDSVKKIVNGFITQFNSLVDFIAEKQDYDATTGKSGTLFGDATLARFKDMLYRDVTGRVGNSGKYHSLSDLGISLDKTGKLVISEDDAFAGAVNNYLSDTIDFFTNTDNGLAVGLNSAVENLTDSSKGLVTLQENYLESEIESIGDSIERKKEYLSIVEDRYKKQFVELEKALSVLQGQSNYINYQLSYLGNSSQKSGSSSGFNFGG